jgi:chemosensory pili system protein ChpA (sensor histidine kinase/response regulator)
LEACQAHLSGHCLAADEGAQLAESLSEAAGQAGLPGLQEACMLLAEALATPESAPAPADLLQEWIEAVDAYLAAPDDATVASTLATLLGDPRCPNPLAEDDVQLVSEVLNARPLADESGEAAMELPAAEPELDDIGSTPEIPQALGELIALLRQELGPMGELVEETLGLLHSQDEEIDPQDWKESVEHVAEQLECFAAAAEAVGLAGLQEACAHLGAAWLSVSTPPETARDCMPLLRGAHVAIADYVARPFEADTVAALVENLCASNWPSPLPAEAGAALREYLSNTDTVYEVSEEQQPERATKATPELVSLTLPEDVPPELLDTLLEEMPVLTEQFSTPITAMLHGGSLEDVNVAQRAAHTLKGAANTVGIPGIANLTHHVEDLLRAFFEHGSVPSPTLAKELLRVSDCLEAMSEAIAGLGPPPDDAVEVLQQVLDRANLIDAGGIAAGDVEITATGQAPTGEVQLPATPVETPTPAQATADASAANTATVRVPAHLIDEYMRLTGESIIQTGQVQERMQHTMRQTRSMQEQFALLQQLGYELEQLIDLGDISQPGLGARNDSHFDPLEFDEYSELHTLSRRMVEAATDAREMGRLVERQLHELLSLLGDQSRLNRESHERIMDTRMVPVQSVVPRWQRAVRQAARVTDKDVEFVVLGADTRMDSEVLSEIVDPLMHMLRNAVDHGIEPQERRSAAGKPAQGRVELGFSRAGSQVLVRCRDDGDGLDLDAVRTAAIERGRIGAQETVSDETLRRMILEPGFSTRSSATQVSGRGIGLDAVYSKVITLGGSFDIKSEAGQGCTVELGVPLTLISAHALLVRVRQYVFAVSTRGVEQIVHAHGGHLRQAGEISTYQVDDKLYPARLLDSLLTLARDERGEEREPRTAILAQSADGPVAIMVQEVIDSRDLVVKGLGRYLPKVRGVMGATILGDGSIAPVLDLPELLRSPARVEVAETYERRSTRPAVDPSIPTALVVDDSLSARRSLERVMGDSGYKVRTARDGMEAVEMLKRLTPDVLLVDLEMPRMNGLELVSHMRAAADAPRVPVVMITSRATAKHRDQALAAGVDIFLTKPFSEDDLLGHVNTLRGCA